MPIVRSGTQTRRLPSCVLPELFCQCLMIPDRLDRCDFKPQNALSHQKRMDFDIRARQIVVLACIWSYSRICIGPRGDIGRPSFTHL